MTKRSLITGITGQDGSLMAKKLLEHGHQVFGTYRQTSVDNLWRLRHLGIIDHITLIEAKIDAYESLTELFKSKLFSHLFHFSGASYAAESFSTPWSTFSTNTGAVFRLLESIRKYAPETLALIPCSSEVFDYSLPNLTVTTLSSASGFRPTNPYGLSHSAISEIVDYYRQTFGLRICLPILFNHESEYRDPRFVVKKIVSGVVGLHDPRRGPLQIGNLDAEKDWGSAKEFVSLLHLAAEMELNCSLVMGTGRLTSVREIVSDALKHLNFQFEFVGHGSNEEVVCLQTGRKLVEVSKDLFRLRETPPFIADVEECKSLLGKKPLLTVLEIIPQMLLFEKSALSL